MTTAPQRRPTTLATVAANERGLDLSRGTHGTTYMAGQTTVDPAGSRPREVRPAFDISDKTKTYFTATQTRKLRSKSDTSYAESSGWGWAGSAARSRGEPSSTGRDVTGRPVVHEVEPVGNIDIDPNMGYAQHAEFTADKLLIKNTHWIRPPYEDEGSPHGEIAVQGTLPHMNWNQFADPKRLSGMDLNNPGISGMTRQMKGTPEHDRALQALKSDRGHRLANFGKINERAYQPLRNDPYVHEERPTGPQYMQPQLNMLMR